jgi:hypothetical protein
VAQAHRILTHGMAASFTVAAAFDLCALLVVLVAIRMRRPAQPAGGPDLTADRELPADRELAADRRWAADRELAADRSLAADQA